MTAQYGQDEFALACLGGIRAGYFLDSGASDGVALSNTYSLEKAYQWQGICVEPNIKLYSELVRNRRCHCINCCLFNHDGQVTFLEADTLSGIVQEYHPIMHQKATTYMVTLRGEVAPGTVTRQCRTVRSILRQFSAPRVIDYWSLDTEGSELTILKAFPFNEYAFRVLTVEHNWLPIRQEIRSLLHRRGYEWVAELGCDDGYVNRAAPPSGAWRSAVWRRR